jgi:hypothetical protein
VGQEYFARYGSFYTIPTSRSLFKDGRRNRLVPDEPE